MAYHDMTRWLSVPIFALMSKIDSCKYNDLLIKFNVVWEKKNENAIVVLNMCFRFENTLLMWFKTENKSFTWNR